MSIVVTDMKMPKDCWDCVMSSFGACNVVGRIWDIPTRPDWCPLVELPEKRRWIPVEEKLPEGVQSVLVRRKDGGIFLWEYCPYSPTDDIWVDEYSNVFSVYDTTHWMELPEFPEGDKR